MRLIACITTQHDWTLLLLAIGVCLVGAWVTIRLTRQVMTTDGAQRFGWAFLGSVAAGSATWCTHFIAILAYEPDGRVSIDPVLTMVSLLIAIAGALPGLLLAGNGRPAWRATLGGAVIGLSIVAMHYVGMLAYRVDGILHWNAGMIALSVVFSVTFSVLSLRSAASGNVRLSVGLLVAAILLLHLTGMSALQIEPIALRQPGLDTVVVRVLAMAVAGVGLMVAGAGAVSFLIDQGTRSEGLERLRELALSDALTGLPNRVAFADHLALAVERARAAGEQLAVVGIDLDRFKEINDLRGHAAGDEALRQVAGHLAAALGAGEYAARVGGDEFAAFAPVSTRAGILDFVTRLDAALQRPIEIEGASCPSAASLGVALFPQDGQTPDRLVANADLAMYRAKADLERSFCFYENGMDEAARDRRELGAELRMAIARGEFELHYQVQQTVKTGAVSGYEVLLRWFHPRRGAVPPATFIPLAEETGEIIAIGEWVLREACREAASWSDPLKIAVNLSPVQFARADLAATLHEILLETGLPASRLELEITESAIFADQASALHTMRRIKALGVSIALDDFGTGYSSFGTLRHYPFDKIKLDRSFVTEVGHSVQAKAIVRAILALGRTLEIPILAEGVETSTQLGILREEGCDEAQGYFLGRPGAIAEQQARAFA